MSGKTVFAKRVEETQLWSYLQKLSDDRTKPLVAQLPVICQEAADRMKLMPSRAPQFTLHDETHALRVVEIMAMVLGNSLNNLNSVEAVLLTLAAYMHDQGMVMDSSECQSLNQNPAFLTFRDNWHLDHVNREEIQGKFRESHLSEETRRDLAAKLAELDQAMLTDYQRSTHARRSAHYVLNTYGHDKRLEVCGVNLSDMLSRLCESHGSPCATIAPFNGFLYDRQMGPFIINEPFLAVILRLADILDFDADRTPDVLFRTIHFSSPVSIQEWEKHRGVKGWTISNKMIRYSAQYEHPVYQAAALKYMDWIDAELSTCHAVCQSFPVNLRKYKLNLPPVVDRSRIEPAHDTYEYHDLEISLSRDEIVKLLMADKLYGRPYLCVRELLQNSLDALRYRHALFGSGKIAWADGNIRMTHSVDANGYEVLECIDNGVGMDIDVVTRFLTKAGRSYYRSPEFERERVFFREKGVDFDPCSQFGIGFMSCFMLGDRIKIATRRDYGPGRQWGDPLVVEITGIGGIVVIRKGDATQEPGTTITISSRKKPSYLDDWVDQVCLTTVLKGYAIATEFPITARCTISEIADEVTIPTNSDWRPTLLESMGVTSMITIEQEFCEINKYLGGRIRESFLVDKRGMPAIANEDAHWVGVSEGSRKDWKVEYKGQRHESHRHHDSQIAIDGVLLCGEPGRPRWYKETHMRLGMHAAHIYDSPFLVDARGEMKPETTPARTPPASMGIDMPPSWSRLRKCVQQASARIWEKVAALIGNGLSPEDFWRLIAIYGAPLTSMRPRTIWEHVGVSVIAADGSVRWSKIRDLGKMVSDQSNGKLMIKDSVGSYVSPDQSLTNWEASGAEHPTIEWLMNRIVALISQLSVESDKIILAPSLPVDQDIPLSDFVLSSVFSDTILCDYTGVAQTALGVQSGIKSANRRHPLSAICAQALMMDRKTALQQYAVSVIPCVADLLNSNRQLELWEQPSRRMRITAHRFFGVDWNSYDKNLQPPYRLWRRDGGWFDLTLKHFEIWRDAPIRPEERE